MNQAIRAASALRCKINKDSYFERKHYCYQDLPLGYQITQQAQPIATNGVLEYDVLKDGKFTHRASSGIARIQLEQDSGKSLYNAHPKYTLVDLNRAGCALLEIVFDPDMRSPEEAAGALRAVQKLLRHIHICDGNMQNGSMRCDVNISMEECLEDDKNSSSTNSTTQRLVGGRVEVKNINSIQHVATAAAYEASRHIAILNKGDAVPRETRGFDATSDSTYRMRSKETAVDYRIFRDPDLPPLCLTEDDIAAALQTASENLETTAERLSCQYKLTDKQIDMLITHQALTYFEATMWCVGGEGGEAGGDSVTSVASVYNWIFGDLLGNMNTLKQTFTECVVSPDQLSCIITMVDRGEITGLQAKALLKDLFLEENHSIHPQELVHRKGWVKITDTLAIHRILDEILDDPKNDKQLRKYLSGNSRVSKYFFGEVMRVSKGQVDPKVLDELLGVALAARGTRQE